MKTTAALLLLTLGQVRDEHISGLITQLGSAQFTERTAAATALESIGRAALPALCNASHNSNDAEIRGTASKLLAKIERSLLTSATMVKLDIRDQAFGEAIKALGEKNHFELVGDLDSLNERLMHKITLRTDKAVPLLTALDRLCAAGQIRPDTDNGFPLAVSRSRNWLWFAPAGVSGPTYDSGPFRIKILQIGYSLERTKFLDRQARQKDEQVNIEQTQISLKLIAEPRLILKQGDAPEILEVVDRQNRSLIPAPGNAFPFGESYQPGSELRFSINLKPQQLPGGAIKRLRGRILVEVGELKPKPLAVPLADSQGKSFDGPDARVTFQTLQLDPTKLPSIKLLIESSFEDLDAQMAPHTMPFLQNQLFLVDDKGKTIDGWDGWYLSQTPKGPKEVEVQFALGPVPVYGGDDQREPIVRTPAKLLFYGIIRTTVEIPFQFDDVPLP
jgi:hypothetical protein